MSVMAGYPVFLIALLVAMAAVLSACTQTMRNGIGTSAFLEARIEVLRYDMIEVQASVLNPEKGATTAYADCAAAQFALSRLNDFLRRVTTEFTGHGDLIIEKTTYLLTPVEPRGEFVLNAQEILAKCRSANVPTV